MESEISPEALEALGVGAVLAGLVGVLVGLAIFVAICAVICFVLQGCFSRIPPEHRQMQPGLVWLLLIPCFNLGWNFFVFLKLADSFKSYFDSQGVTDVGDCGKGLGLAYSIAAVASFVVSFVFACLSPVAGIAALVLLILVLVKAVGLKNRIPAAA